MNFLFGAAVWMIIGGMILGKANAIHNTKCEQIGAAPPVESLAIAMLWPALVGYVITSGPMKETECNEVK